MRLHPTLRHTPPAILLAALSTSIFFACNEGGWQTSAPPAGSEELTVELVGSPPPDLGLLTSGSLTFQSNLDGDYEVRIVPDGDLTLEYTFAIGTLMAGVPVETTFLGVDLGGLGASLVVFEVTTATGLTGSLEVNVGVDSETFPIGVGGYGDVTYDGTRNTVVVTEPQSGSIQVLDVNPTSIWYGQVVGALPPGPDVGPYRVKVTPDGQTAYLLYRSTLLEMDIEAGSLVNTLPLPGSFDPSGIDVTPNSELVYLGYLQTLLYYDSASTAEPAAVQPTGLLDALIDGGDVAITPDGSLALYSWFGTSNRGLWVVDIDPLSAGYNTLLATHLWGADPQVPEVGFVLPKAAVAPSGATGYAGGLAGLALIDLETVGFPVVDTDPDLWFEGIVTISDGLNDYEVIFDSLGFVGLVDADLNLIGWVDVVPGLIDRGAYDPVGQRLFLVRDQQGTQSELVVVSIL